MSTGNSSDTSDAPSRDSDTGGTAASSSTRAYTYLIIASVFEIAFSLGTKGSEGFTVLVPSLIGIAGGVVSVYALSLALRSIDVGIGYTIWTGIGSVGTVVIGSFVFDESITLFKVVCFAAIIAGVVGLHVTSIGEGAEEQSAAARGE